MDFNGTIIEESLADTSVLNDVHIVSTKVEPITERHQTPWVQQWTVHRVTLPAEKAATVAERIRKALDHEHAWYADYKTTAEHYIIFPDKIFHITDRTDAAQYAAAREHGLALGIPSYQVDFKPVS